MTWIQELEKIIKGDVITDETTLKEYSTDASLFEVHPKVVIFPKNESDIKAVVDFVDKNKQKYPKLSITARSAGTDMSGGPLNESIILGFTKYINHIRGFEGSSVRVEPGVYYRDFEKETLKRGLLLPTYPASKSLAALGGMIANNGAGEKTLHYGKTADYVEELKVVLADGGNYTFSSISREELNKKRAQEDFEGEIYRKTHDLLEKNYDLIQKSKPRVSKNSAGYALWDIWDREKFDLTRLFSGAQGTLGMITEAKLRLVKPKTHTRVGVLFFNDIKQLPQVVNNLLPLDPEGLETFDDETLKLAIKFFPEIASRIEGQNLFSLAWQFLPEFFIALRMLGLPRYTVIVQFAEDSDREAEEKLVLMKKALKDFKGHMRIMHSAASAEKYWVIRRESFSLLRKHVSTKRTAPFIDDFIVEPKNLPEFLPKVFEILDEYNIHATLAGHAGSGNFHIIPLMNLSKKEEVDKIPAVAEKVYNLIIKYGGSITAEHNDGLIRSPYLEKMYGKTMYHLFEEIKNIFDPKNIFNPGKKVYSSLDYAIKHISHK